MNQRFILKVYYYNNYQFQIINFRNYLIFQIIKVTNGNEFDIGKGVWRETL